MSDSSAIQLPAVITIDGPAGAGKSTLGALLARRLGYLYFDTGVMYRALTLIALREELDPADGPALAALAQRITIDVQPPAIADGRQYTVVVEGHDVTWAIRAPEVDANVSQVSSYPAVRRELAARQRAIGLQGRVVMVGRDIGTVVMPDAGLKIYLATSLAERARRRRDEQHDRGRTVVVDQVREELARRDDRDQHVMQPAADAVLLQTDDLSPEDEVDWVMNYLLQQAQQRSTRHAAEG